MSRYRKVLDGERVRPNQKRWRMRCCDCGLVHVMDFYIVDGMVEFVARRDRKATAASRKRKFAEFEKEAP